jgi:hypothetical protein
MFIERTLAAELDVSSLPLCTESMQVEGLSIENLRSIPYRVAFTVARVMEVVAALRCSDNVDPPLTRTLVRMIGREFTTNDTAARRELGYLGATTRAEGLSRMAPHA